MLSKRILSMVLVLILVLGITSFSVWANKDVVKEPFLYPGMSYKKALAELKLGEKNGLWIVIESEKELERLWGVKVMAISYSYDEDIVKFMVFFKNRLVSWMKYDTYPGEDDEEEFDPNLYEEEEYYISEEFYDLIYKDD